MTCDPSTPGLWRRPTHKFKLDRALGIIKDNQIIWSKGYGVRRLNYPDRVDEETVFPIASITKSFTAALISMLVDEGKLNWDDITVKHLPNFQLYDANFTNQITIRDMLSHRTGLERADLLWYLTSYNQQEVINHIKFLKPKWSIRSRFSYSNILYSAIGMLQETVTGIPWDILISEKIFKPLGMTSSFTSLNDLNALPNFANPHTMFNNQLYPIVWPNYDNCKPAINICSNVIDLLKWVQLHMQDGVFDQKRLISSKSIEEMHRPQTVINDSSWYEFYPESSFLTYGLGWVIFDYKGRKVIEHIGSGQGMTALVTMVPEENLGIVILVNKDTYAMFPGVISRRVFDDFFGNSSVDWSSKFFKAYKKIQDEVIEQEKIDIENRIQNSKPSLTLEKYAGIYEDPLYGRINVNYSNEALHFESVTFNGQLEHWHLDTFRLLPQIQPSPIIEKIFVTFSFNSLGKVDGMKVRTSEGTSFIKLDEAAWSISTE